MAVFNIIAPFFFSFLFTFLFLASTLNNVRDDWGEEGVDGSRDVREFTSEYEFFVIVNRIVRRRTREDFFQGRIRFLPFLLLS